ncbi:MAG: alanine racemase [Candidatus Wallbacteria bacterium]|nr:alanine racemase [Candidatus Wallbacteria bacterium]
MTIFPDIKKPSLLVHRGRCRKNIASMAEFSRHNKVRFRPHFKTHQSTEVGNLFRESGIDQITVSSVSMARFFSDAGESDITIAFPVNVRELDDIVELSRKIRLGLLLESVESADLIGRSGLSADIWLKIDTGNRRTGIDCRDELSAGAILTSAGQFPGLRIRGLLTHAGHTYRAGSAKNILDVHKQSVCKMIRLRDRLTSSHGRLEISIGDTPALSLRPDLSEIDEIRPGNFVYYDATQLAMGVCAEDDIAAVAACPVVAHHKDRNELVIYGGAVHLSKDRIVAQGHDCYGLVVILNESGWSDLLPGASVTALSQEHGIVRGGGEIFDLFPIGSLIGVIPVHSCLTADLLRRETVMI